MRTGRAGARRLRAALHEPAEARLEPGLEIVGNRLFVPTDGQRRRAFGLARFRGRDDHRRRRLRPPSPPRHDGQRDRARLGRRAPWRRASPRTSTSAWAASSSRHPRRDPRPRRSLRSGCSAGPVEMILGREVFDAGRLLVDIEGRMVTAVPRDTARGRPPAGRRASRHADHSGRSRRRCGPGGVRPRQWQRGAGRPRLCGADRPHRARRIVERRSGGGLGGARERDIVVLRNLRVAGREFRDVPAAIDPGETASDLNIGTSILRHFVITTDFPQRAVWLEPRE